MFTTDHYSVQHGSKHVWPSSVDKISKARLQSRYCRHISSIESDWPQRYVRLALVKGEKVTKGGKDLEETTRLTLRGKIDDVLMMKEPLGDLIDIFHYQNKPCPRLILVMGGPGKC